MDGRDTNTYRDEIPRWHLSCCQFYFAPLPSLELMIYVDNAHAIYNILT